MTRLPPQPQVPLLPGGPIAPVTKQVNRLLNTSQVIQIALIVIFALPLLVHLVNMLNIRVMGWEYFDISNVMGHMNRSGSGQTVPSPPLDIDLEGQNLPLLGVGVTNRFPPLPQALANGLAVGGTSARILFPILLTIGWFATLWWLFREVFTGIGIKQPRLIGLLAAGLTAWAVMGGLPNVYRSLYFTGNNIPDFTPIVLTTVQISVLVWSLRGRRNSFATAIGILLLVVLIGGFNFSSALLQCGLGLIVMLALPIMLPRERRNAMLLTGLLMVIASLISVVISQALWMGEVTRPFIDSTVWRLGNAFFGGTLTWIGQTLALNAAVPIVLSIVLSATAIHLFGPVRKEPLPLKQVGLRVIPVLLVTYLLLHFCFLGTQPLELHAQAILTAAALVIGYLIGLSIRRSSTTIQLSGWVMALVALLLIAGPIVQAGRTLVESRQLTVYAVEWDARDRAIREAVANGQQTGRVRPLAVEMATFAGLPTDSDLLRSGIIPSPIARYYGLTELVLDE